MANESPLPPGDVHLNLRTLVRSGKWSFPGDTPQLKPLTLVKLLQEQDFARHPPLLHPEDGGAHQRRARDQPRGLPRRLRQSPSAGGSRHLPVRRDLRGVLRRRTRPDPTRAARRDPGQVPITTEHLRSAPGLPPSVDLQTEINAGRVFWVDYKAMDGLDNGTHPLGPKYMYSPMVAFLARPQGITPFAIQCGQDPAGRQIYTPTDGWSWKMARNCVLVAHNTYQEVVTHLGRTHLLSEPVLLATVRNLSPRHPVAPLLQCHFEGTFNINRLAVDLLIQPGEAVEAVIGSSLPAPTSSSLRSGRTIPSAATICPNGSPATAPIAPPPWLDTRTTTMASWSGTRSRAGPPISSGRTTERTRTCTPTTSCRHGRRRSLA